MPKLYDYTSKIISINFYNSELFTINNFLYIFNISLSSLYNWINEYKNGILHTKNNIRTKYNSKYSFEIENFIVTYIVQKGHFTFHKLKNRIMKIFGIVIAKHSLYKILKRNNITHKKIQTKIIPIHRSTQKQKIKNLINEIHKKDPNKIISIDESNFNIHMTQKYGWSKKGTKITKIFKNPNRCKKTLLMGISKNKIIGTKIVNGSANNKIFYDFLEKDIVNKVANASLLMDNVRFHHSKNIQTLVNDSGNKIIYNVSYNPDSNPIEQSFNVIKNNVRSICPITEKQLISSIEKSFKLLNKKKLSNMFYHSLQI